MWYREGKVEDVREGAGGGRKIYHVNVGNHQYAYHAQPTNLDNHLKPKIYG
jgi:hypothetical protein